jgi:transposase
LQCFGIEVLRFTNLETLGISMECWRGSTKVCNGEKQPPPSPLLGKGLSIFSGGMLTSYAVMGYKGNVGWRGRMRRIKRPTKRVANSGQWGFGFCQGPVPTAAERKPIGDDRFVDDEPYHILIGDRRLDQVLVDNDMRWVVELRKLLVSLDYSLLTAKYSARGRRALHPRTVLGLIVCGLFVKQIALRELEQLSVANIGAWWMCGGRRIDHSTIGKFVQLHEDVLGQQFVTALAAWVVQRLKLRPGVSSIDGTVVESAASRWKLLQTEAAALAAAEATKAAQAEPDNAALQQTAQAAEEVARVAEQRSAKRTQQGKPTETVVVACSDPDAVVQPRKDKVKRPAYKASTLMHEAGVIIGQYVDPSSETAAVKPLLEQHQAVFAQLPPTLLLDAGYHHGEVLGEAAEQGIDVLCPSGKAMGDDDWEKKGAKGLFAKNQFRYDEQRDVYLCPANESLSYADQGKDGRGHPYRRFRTAACTRCSMRARCTAGKHGRSIKRYSGDEYKEAMALVLMQPRAREVYRRRMPIAETVHAEFRERFGLRRFHRRGLSAVRAEFGLYCIFQREESPAGGCGACRLCCLWPPWSR